MFSVADGVNSIVGINSIPCTQVYLSVVEHLDDWLGSPNECHRFTIDTSTGNLSCSCSHYCSCRSSCIGASVTTIVIHRSCHCYINVFFTIVFSSIFLERNLVNHLYKHFIYRSLQTMSRTRFSSIVGLIKPSLKSTFLRGSWQNTTIPKSHNIRVNF
jgi:hypothetical protein